MSKKESIVTFFKKNGVYIAVAVVVLTIAIIAAVALASKGGDSTPTFKPNTSSSSNSSSSSSSSSSKVDSSSQITPTVISFTMPVENGEIIKEFTQDTVVFNQTLGVYSAHLAVDITGAEGAKVFAAYSGKIESIETSYLLGTVITIDHGNDLKTVYSSLEVEENLAVGQTINEGDQLGVISTSNRQEYKDGAHLHFEVRKNGEKVNPMDYLLLQEDK